MPAFDPGDGGSLINLAPARLTPETIKLLNVQRRGIAAREANDMAAAVILELEFMELCISVMRTMIAEANPDADTDAILARIPISKILDLFQAVISPAP